MLLRGLLIGGNSGWTGVAVALAVVVHGAPVPAQQMSGNCQFHTGARAGYTIDFTGEPGFETGPVGAPCQDGLGSFGVLVAPGRLSDTPPAGTAGGFSLTCHFSYGPNAGRIIDFRHIHGAVPAAVGMPCQDGAGSHGVTVAPDTPGALRLSMRCRFTTGPRSGQDVDFTGVPGASPGVIGGPCSDGWQSSGVVIE